MVPPAESQLQSSISITKVKSINSKGGVVGLIRRLTITLAMVFFLFPFIWMVILSLRPNSVNTSGKIGFPFIPTISHYVGMISSTDILNALWTSVETSFITMLLALVVGVPSAYAIASLRLKWDWVVILLPRMLPFMGFVVPWYVMFLNIHLLGTFIPISIAELVVSLPILVWSTASYLATLPKQLEEAARIDGANSIQILLYIIIPSGLPGIVTGAILAWINAWNMFFFPLILGGASTGTLPVAAAQFVSYGTVDYGGLASVATLMILPVLVVTLYLQKYIVTGLTSGAVKG